MSDYTSPLNALKRIKSEAGTPYFSSLYDIDMWREDFGIIETALKEKEKQDKFFETIKPEDLLLAIDLLIYLDTSLNANEDRYSGNDCAKSTEIILHYNQKHKEFPNAEKRHAIISGLITKLEAVI